MQVVYQPVEALPDLDVVRHGTTSVPPDERQRHIEEGCCTATRSAIDGGIPRDWQWATMEVIARRPWRAREKAAQMRKAADIQVLSYRLPERAFTDLRSASTDLIERTSRVRIRKGRDLGMVVQ
jgi:hypothetical protein